jgi:hypothetical protein
MVGLTLRTGRLPGAGRAALTFNRALSKIHGFAAARALVGLVKLVGKNFIFRTAFRAAAGKRTQVFELLKTRTMLRCGFLRHNSSSFFGSVLKWLHINRSAFPQRILISI